MKVFSVGSAPMESSVSIILNTPQSRVPEVCDITASTSYRTNRLTVTKIVTGLFIRFAPFCSFRQQKAKTPQNRDSEAKKGKKNGTPDEIRTHDLLLRRQTLYPAELRVPMSFAS